MPRSLDLARLRQFEPDAARDASLTPDAGKSGADASIASSAERWPSREPLRDGQISIKAPLDVIERFRRLCQDDRRTYADMLAILMDGHERQG